MARSALLLSARRLVAQGWTQQADARAADGTAVHPWDAAAASWSLLGALVAAVEEAASVRGEQCALSDLALACVSLADSLDADSLEFWNDAAGRTQEDVLAAIDDADEQPGLDDDPVSFSAN
jgi:hypothetical protein